MKLETKSDFSYTLEITREDCQKNGISFDKIKEYETYKQNKHLYDKVPAYYFEPPTPPVQPKKSCLLKRIFGKKKVASENTPPPEKSKTEMDLYFDKKFEEIKELGLPLYSKVDLKQLSQNESKLIALVIKYADTEAPKENPNFENRGGFSYHYEITENDTIIFDVDTLVRKM